MRVNIFQLDELPFLKSHKWEWSGYFKGKQNHLPLIRNASFEHEDILAKIFVYSLNFKRGKGQSNNHVSLLMEMEICKVDHLYQIMNENMEQKTFSKETGEIKAFQEKSRKYFTEFFRKNSLNLRSKEKQTFLFNVYRNKNGQYSVKCMFNIINYDPEMASFLKQSTPPPLPYRITDIGVIKQLEFKYNGLLSNLSKDMNELNEEYMSFYDNAYYKYDETVLKLQVFGNYPLLRSKTYIPIKFIDFYQQNKKNHEEPLTGNIYSNADKDCMYGHFIGYNANSINEVEGDYCGICQIEIDKLQENQILTQLRDNVFNPKKQEVYYCPEYNRFKLVHKQIVNKGREKQQKIEEKTDFEEQTIENKETPKVQLSLKYLNYYHFRTNLKRITNKDRIIFELPENLEEFKLTFEINDNQLPILDPAKGKYCRHFAFTDLRLFYLSFNPETQEYTCPIPKCGQKMKDFEILYLKETSILINFMKYKCQQKNEFYQKSIIIVDQNTKKVFLKYYYQEKEELQTKIQEIKDYYETLVDPLMPFSEYRLSIPDKNKQKKQQEYMFGGWREPEEEEDLSSFNEDNDDE